MISCRRNVHLRAVFRPLRRNYYRAGGSGQIHYPSARGISRQGMRHVKGLCPHL